MRMSKHPVIRYIDGKRYRVTRIESTYGKRRGRKAAPLPEKIRKAPVAPTV